MPVSVKTRRGTAAALLLLAVFAAAFVLTLLTPMVADDYNYAFSWATDQRIGSLRDVAESMSCHRTYSNGRVFAHGFVQLFSFLPHWLFALCNALVCTGEAFLLHCYLLRRSGRPRPGLLACALGLLWICMPVFGQVFLWADGACNYSWGLLLALAALYPFFLSASEASAPPLAARIAFLPLLFVAGAWSEHISFSLLAACFCLTLVRWIRSRRFPAYLFVLLVCGGVGYLYLMLAPSMLGGGESTRGSLSAEAVLGLFRRLGELLSRLPGGALPVLIVGALALAALILCRIRLGLRRTLALLSGAVTLVFLLAAALLGLRILRAGEGLWGLISSTAVSLLLAFCCFLIPFTLALLRGTEGERLLLPGLIFLGGLCSLPLFVFASYFPARGCAAAVLFSVLAGVLLLADGEKSRGKTAAAALLALLALLFVLCFTLGTADILTVHRSEELRQERIAQALAADGIASAPAHPVRSKYSAQYGLADLNTEGEWPNDAMAKYYGLREIRLP